MIISMKLSNRKYERTSFQQRAGVLDVEILYRSDSFFNLVLVVILFRQMIKGFFFRARVCESCKFLT